MDSSVGRVGNGFNWKTGGREEGKKKGKKKDKKPHWLVAKEHGKRKNGSEKRKKRTHKEEDEEDEKEEQHKKTKLQKRDREESAGLKRKTPAEQCEYVWGEISK